MKIFRLIRSQPASAAYNMALDEVIFTTCCQKGIPTFRVYRWENPSFSAGISQDVRVVADMQRCLEDGVEVVRRMTGGGILFHDDEITYSFACRKADIGEPQETLVSYRHICAFLLRFYESLGIEAYFALQDKDFIRQSIPHHICSASREKYDIVAGSKKIGGNAQKRRRQELFQHGIIPCSIDWDLVGRYLRGWAQDISLGCASLSELLGRMPDKDIIEEVLIRSFAQQFDVSFIQENLAPEEESLCRRLIETKYANPDWNHKKIRLDQALLA